MTPAESAFDEVLRHGSPALVDAWLDQLREGVLLLEDGRVTGLNSAAAAMLQVDRTVAAGLPAISVLRDHRLEQLALGPVTGERVELDVRGNWLAAERTPAGLLLSDLSELRRSRQEARELLAVLSHELRTPVAAVRSALEALMAGDVPDPVRERFLSGALAEAERLSRLLSDLTVDVKPPRERSVDLEHALRRAVALTATVAKRRGVRVELEPVPAEVWVDEDKLVQAAVNLIENAALHGPAGEVVTVASWTDETVACIEVRDRGASLSQTVIAELFEVSSLGNVKAKGTGLGLYIVRSLARAWGGAAWGRPLPGAGGNAFGVKVPLTAARARSSQRVNSSSGSTSGESPR